MPERKEAAPGFNPGPSEGWSSMPALDPIVRSELQDELGRIFGAVDKTVVLVTHDMAEAAFFGDEIVLLRAGAVVQRGTFEALALRPSDPFVTTFLRAHRGLPDVAERARA